MTEMNNDTEIDSKSIYIYIIKSKEIIVKNIGGLTINQPVEMDSG